MSGGLLRNKISRYKRSALLPNMFHSKDGVCRSRLFVWCTHNVVQNLGYFFCQHSRMTVAVPLCTQRSSGAGVALHSRDGRNIHTLIIFYPLLSKTISHWTPRSISRSPSKISIAFLQTVADQRCRTIVHTENVLKRAWRSTQGAGETFTHFAGFIFAWAKTTLHCTPRSTSHSP